MGRIPIDNSGIIHDFQVEAQAADVAYATGDHPIPSLGTAKDKRAVRYLIDILKKYPEVEVRMKAAEALGNIGEKSAYDDLKKALKDYCASGQKSAWL